MVYLTPHECTFKVVFSLLYKWGIFILITVIPFSKFFNLDLGQESEKSEIYNSNENDDIINQDSLSKNSDSNYSKEKEDALDNENDNKKKMRKIKMFYYQII